MSSPRVLIVKLGALGDLFFALPAVYAIKKAFPQSQVEWLVTDGLKEALTGFVAIDTIHTIPGRQLYVTSPFQQLKTLWQARDQLAKSYDAILLLHRHNGYLPFLWGRGPIFQLRRDPLNALSRLILSGGEDIVVPPLQQHESLAIRSVTQAAIKSLGGGELSGSWIVPPPLSVLPSEKIFVHFGGGANAKTQFTLKQWPKMDGLLSELLRTRREKIVLVGGPEDVSDARAVTQKLDPQETRIINQVGKTPLGELIRQIASAKIFVGPDSGPLHVADQMGIPTVGIFGPTSSVSWGLIGAKSQCLSEDVSCRPCYQDDGYFPPCHHQHQCMEKLGVEKVSRAISAQLS